MSSLQEAEFLEAALLELFRDERQNRPRVLLLNAKPDVVIVEFPKKIRTEHPLGTLFRADVKMCQKHWQSGPLKGQAKGDLYGRAKADTIEVLQPGKSGVYAKEIRDRVYRWQSSKDNDPLMVLRDKAISSGTVEPHKRIASVTSFRRSDAVRKWVLARAGQHCEGCSNPAPFLTRNGNPFFEVHHVKALSEGGDDTIFNTVALCPNCHRRTEMASDAKEFNLMLTSKVVELEPSNS